MTIVTPEAAVKATPRERLIDDLRQMADWLEAHNSAPVGPWDAFRFQTEVDDLPIGMRRQAVDAIAADLGLTAEPLGDGEGAHYWAVKSIGRVQYVVVSLKPGDEDETAVRA